MTAMVQSTVWGSLRLAPITTVWAHSGSPQLLQDTEDGGGEKQTEEETGAMSESESEEEEEEEEGDEEEEGRRNDSMSLRAQLDQV